MNHPLLFLTKKCVKEMDISTQVHNHNQISSVPRTTMMKQNKLQQHNIMRHNYVFIVIVLLFIHKYTEAAVLFKNIPIEENALNSTSSSLDEPILTTFRYKRSGGFPKIPMQEKSTYFTSRECGTRVVHFDPLRKGKIVGGTSVNKNLKL